MNNLGLSPSAPYIYFKKYIHPNAYCYIITYDKRIVTTILSGVVCKTGPKTVMGYHGRPTRFGLDVVQSIGKHINHWYPLGYTLMWAFVVPPRIDLFETVSF